MHFDRTHPKGIGRVESVIERRFMNSQDFKEVRAAILRFEDSRNED